MNTYFYHRYRLIGVPLKVRFNRLVLLHRHLRSSHFKILSSELGDFSCEFLPNLDGVGGKAKMVKFPLAGNWILMFSDFG